MLVFALSLWKIFSWGFTYFDQFILTNPLELFALLWSRNCCVALPHDATGLSAVCDCGIS